MISVIIFKINTIYKFIYIFSWRVLHLKLYKNPVKYIPKDSFYCYTIISVERRRFKINKCIFLKKDLLNNDLCMYTKSDCLMDQCKECGINE